MLKSHHYLLGLFWSAAIFLLPLPLLQALALGLPSSSSAILGIQLGTIAYIWMLFVIFVSTKPKWLDRLIGLPSMYFVHAFLGLSLIVLAYLHTKMSPSDGLIKLTGDLGLWIMIAVAAYSLLFLSDWLTARVQFLRTIVRFFEKNLFHHEVTIWLHRLNIVATFFVFIHVLLIGYIMQIQSFAWLFILYSLFVFSAYTIFFIRKFRGYSRANLVQVKHLASRITQITLKFNSGHQRILNNYRPGDYLFIAFREIADMKELHPFSFVNFDAAAREVTLAIRADGDFSGRIAQLRVGETARIDGPYGTLDDRMRELTADGQSVVMLAGGTGAFPLINLAMQYASSKEIYFIWTVSDEKELVYRQLLQKIAADNPRFHYFESIHRLNLQKLSQMVPNKVRDQATFLMSGSNQMMIGYRGLLRQYGIRARHIFYEKFNF
ncbi:MAG: FAD-binding oxidoreductase [Oenococcus sp.]|uniref:FAD-binding oxidoreductase n=1 Tax=Oenococcus sp. TaxID=1979414 RepID=UPI0039EA96CB